MAKLHNNEVFTRQLCSDLSKMLNLPYDVVRQVIDGLGLYILHEMVKLGEEARKNGKYEKFKVEVPMIGTIEVFPKKYPTNEHSILEGWALRTSFSVREPFLLKARHAYYAGEDPLLQNLSANFEGMIKEKYAKLISVEGKGEYEDE